MQSRQRGGVKYQSVRPISSLEQPSRMFQSRAKCVSVATNDPQRIELPVFFNTPQRHNKVMVSIDHKIKRFENSQTAQSMPDKLRTQNKVSASAHLQASACKRAGKQRDEGRAYYCMGVLYDNLKKWKSAITQYSNFLGICKEINDVHGEGLAYNCIGVDYQWLAQETPKLMEKAIVYHKLHEEVADINGKFLASINLGLCYEYDQRLSLFYYQQALKYAVTMSSVVGQTLAIGNIGKICQKGLYDNTDRMKTFIEKYMELAHQLADEGGLMKGHLKLATVSANRGDYNEAKQNFQKALHMSQNDKQSYTQAKCGYAISNAEMNMEKYLNEQSLQFKS